VTEWLRISTTGKRIGKVSLSGRMCVEMNAREVKIVAAQRRDVLADVSEKAMARHWLRHGVAGQV
jgi:predicted GTPase